MQKILVPIDFSPTSAAALRLACYLADATGYGLEAVHVFDGYDGEKAEVVKRGSARVRARVRERLEKFVGLHADPATFTGQRGHHATLPLVGCREVVGAAVRELVRLSKRDTTAFIVMGGVGSGIPNPATPLFGSVAKSVVREAGCPVLLLPRGIAPPRIGRVAVAFDGTDTLGQLTEETEFLRSALRPELSFVHVRDPDDRASAGPDDLPEGWADSLPDYPATRVLLPPGDVTTELLQYATDHDVDLLVLGRHSRQFPLNFLVRSSIPQLAGIGYVAILVVPLARA